MITLYTVIPTISYLLLLLLLLLVLLLLDPTLSLDRLRLEEWAEGDVSKCAAAAAAAAGVALVFEREDEEEVEEAEEAEEEGCGPVEQAGAKDCLFPDLEILAEEDEGDDALAPCDAEPVELGVSVALWEEEWTRPCLRRVS